MSYRNGVVLNLIVMSVWGVVTEIFDAENVYLFLLMVCTVLVNDQVLGVFCSVWVS